MFSGMSHRTTGFAALAVCLGAALAHAQPALSTEQAIADADRTLACVREPHADIAQWVRLLGEAKATLASRTASEAARRDARESVIVLEGRLRESAAALGACAERAPARAVAAPTTPSAPVMEAVSVHVHARPSRVIDGRGQVDPRDVHEGLLRIGGALDACYEQLTERRAIETGDAHFVFAVSGREVRSHAIEGLGIGDAPFSQCVARTVRNFRVSRGATGGEARVDVILHFGPE